MYRYETWDLCSSGFRHWALGFGKKLVRGARGVGRGKNKVFSGQRAARYEISFRNAFLSVSCTYIKQIT